MLLKATASTIGFLSITSGKYLKFVEGLKHGVSEGVSPAGGALFCAGRRCLMRGPWWWVRWRGWVTVAACDTGPGIPPEDQERVFDRFVRGSLAEAGHIPGTGVVHFKSSWGKAVGSQTLRRARSAEQNRGRSGGIDMFYG